jgi:hypothetical protein
MGFERNSQVKIPSNQINKYRSYYSIAAQQCEKQNLTMNPCFTDAEGCFSISIVRKNKLKIG